MKLVPVIEHTCHHSYTNTHSAELVPCFYFPFHQHECWCWWWWWFSGPLNGQAVSFWNWLKRGCWMHWRWWRWWWWVSVTPAQVISIMLAPIPWTRHMALLTKYIIFGTHFPNISGFAAAICGPAEAELSSGVCLHRHSSYHGYADLIADS